MKINQSCFLRTDVVDTVQYMRWDASLNWAFFEYWNTIFINWAILQLYNESVHFISNTYDIVSKSSLCVPLSYIIVLDHTQKSHRVQTLCE